MKTTKKNTADKIILDWAKAKEIVQRWQAVGLEVVFSNGCFDLMHLGHIDNLERAANLGDKLVVALNSDASVKRLKGEHRPISNEASRLAVMAALEFVDMVLIFEEETPFEIISTLQPDILAKGGDYKPEQIVGSDIVLEKGGKVIALPFVEGYSTSALEAKIIADAKEKKTKANKAKK